MDSNSFDRREFLRTAATVLVGTTRFGFWQAPAIVTSERARPSVGFGATAGDVDGNRAIVWSRTDRPAKLVVEYSTTESFRDMKRLVGPAALEATDFTARVDLSPLPEDQRIFYRVRFHSLADL